jgi:hypothetical protein
MSTQVYTTILKEIGSIMGKLTVPATWVSRLVCLDSMVTSYM